MGSVVRGGRYLYFNICEQDEKCVRAGNCPLAVDVTTSEELAESGGVYRRYIRGRYDECSPVYECEENFEEV